MNKNLLRIITLTLTCLCGSGSFWYKNNIEDAVFYELFYEKSVVTDGFAVNGVNVINKSWTKPAKNVTLSFNITSPKRDIYRRYLEMHNEKGYEENESKINSDVAILTWMHGVVVNPPNYQEENDFCISVVCSELKNQTSFPVTLLWMDNKSSKVVEPELTVGTKRCIPLANRSFALKYHVVAVILFGIACLSAGVLIASFLVKQDSAHDESNEALSKAFGAIQQFMEDWKNPRENESQVEN